MLSLIPQPYRTIAVAAVLAALVGMGWAAGYHVRGLEADETIGKMNAALAQQKLDAAALLATETAKVTAAEQAMADFKDQQGAKDVANSNAINDLAGKLSVSLRSATAKSRLCGGGAANPNPAAAGAGGANAATANWQLPDATVGFLERFAKDADEVNNAYASCRAERLNLTTPAVQ